MLQSLFIGNPSPNPHKKGEIMENKRQCDETKACHVFRQKWVGRRVRYDTCEFRYGMHGAPTPILGREGNVVAIGEIQRRMRNHTGVLVVEITEESGRKWEDSILASQVSVISAVRTALKR